MKREFQIKATTRWLFFFTNKISRRVFCFGVPLKAFKVTNISFAAGHFDERIGMGAEGEVVLVHTENQWKAGRVIFAEFLRLHPELHVRYTENVYNNFVRVHGPRLAKMDVMRKTGLRSPAIFDSTKFDKIAFDIMTRKHLGDLSEDQDSHC